MFSVNAGSGTKQWKMNKDPQRITKIEPFINQYDWNWIYFPWKAEDYKKFETKNKQSLLIFW